MIDFTEIQDGEAWELFARDFLQSLGFLVESSPDRGADGGKDLIVTESLCGRLKSYKFRWLVSCKHYAVSNRSVSENEELNILERVRNFKVDGFIAFYSTLPSTGLNARLNSLLKGQDIKDYKVFDHKLIENYLIRVGYADLLIRYFPESYKAVKPLHILLDEYTPLNCLVCGRDLLELLYREDYSANLVFTSEEVDEKIRIKKVHWVCKEHDIPSTTDDTAWQDISDLEIPVVFLNWMQLHLTKIRSGEEIYSDKAFADLLEFMTGMAQKVFRETTELEKSRVRLLSTFAG